MMVRVIYLVFISLSLFLAGCADDNSNSSSSNQNISGDGTVGGTGSVANVKEYFTAGPQTTVSAAVNAKESSREQNVKSKNDCNTLSSRLSSRKKYL